MGLSIPLEFDSGALEAVAVEAGDLLDRHGERVRAPESEVRGVGPGATWAGEGFDGEGELARVQFRVKGVGAAVPALGAIRARDANKPPD